MRAAFAGFALSLLASLGVANPATAQTPAPGCRPPPPAELIGQAANLDYELTDTDGLNVVLVHAFGPTTLSDRNCVPDPAQGALQVTVNYGVGPDTTPEQHARDMIFGTLARSRPDRAARDFPPITVDAFNVGGMPGAEAVVLDETQSDVAVFRYALVFVFSDGAKGLLSAVGPRDRFDALLPSFHRVAIGLRSRRNAAGMHQDLIGATESMLARLRGPVLNQALDACLSGVHDEAISRANASGFPPFELQPGPGGVDWSVSAAPEDDSGRITFGVTEGPSSMMAGRRSLKCSIVAAPGFETLFRQAFEERFQGEGDRRMFTISGGQIGRSGGAIVLGRGSGIGSAIFNSEQRGVAIAIEITGLN